MKISTLGFPSTEEAKLGKILPLAKNAAYTLQAFDASGVPDVLLVFGEVGAYQAQLTGLSGLPVQIGVVAKQPPEQAGYFHLPFPLVASRVLRVLDGLSGVGGIEPPSTPAQPEHTAITVTAEPAAIAAPIEGDTALQYRVLVVDDSLPMQKALALELEKLPATVHIDFAGSGEEALTMTEEQRYDFIFLDIMMPGIDGFEACTQMRKRPAMKKTPIIMLTAKTSPMDEVKGVIAGCSTYLTKPIVHEDFQKVMQRITKWVDNFSVRD
ncbi:response regulator [Methylovulum psychrotolerans]|jgi:twitching motility two-component system response regulator PilG|uniref:Response regulator n=1 Tax=Methylovulum psychrotolerans TaxID=1704499 RepID=A0A2S5CLS3_9GAMM|nr:response regulator [Methylovulum psychrotolerans]MBT9097291.1 response regulator [Methylovulum psychrotolerans]POZ51769.1 response regulator [Methylovulum psychrotolerans]